jgi:hypothetical protein
MVARAFCELFVAGCLEVKTQDVGGEVRRLYRAVDDVDTALLGRVERAVVRCLRTFRSFAALLELCADEVRMGGQGARGEAELERAKLLAEMGEVIDDALEYLPPACSCSI